MKKRSAFTLIELLVVIAIIAILAAILFPVFAQAKAAAKKTVDLSNMKQVQTGTLIYLGDTDDQYPLAFGQDSGGAWHGGTRLLLPYNWSTMTPATDARTYESQSLAQNAILPYTKSVDLFSSPAGTSDPSPLPTTYVTGNSAPKKFTPTYNGLLMGYNSTGMQSPASVPVYWDGYGNSAMLGYSISNPELICPVASTACTYVPYTSTCSGSTNGTSGTMYGSAFPTPYSFKLLGPGQNWSFADGHAKFHHMADATTTGSNGYTDPFVYYNTDGTIPSPGYYWSDGCFAWLFRPDYVPSN